MERLLCIEGLRAHRAAEERFVRSRHGGSRDRHARQHEYCRRARAGCDRARRSEASHVADTAKDQARQVKDEFATQASGLVDQAKSELRDQGRTQADQVSNAIRRVSDQAGALAAVASTKPAT